MTETQPRQKVFFSESLNGIITFIMIPRLSDKDLTKLFYELLELNTALRALKGFILTKHPTKTNETK